MADTTRMGPADEAFNRGDAAYFDLYRDDVAVHGLPGMGGTVELSPTDRRDACAGSRLGIVSPRQT